MLAARVTGAALLHDLERPQESAPAALPIGGTVTAAAFDPLGRWIAVAQPRVPQCFNRFSGIPSSFAKSAERQ